jgi:hypothetical protein
MTALLIILGYLVGATITLTMLRCAGLIDLDDDDGHVPAVIATLFWPIALVIWGIAILAHIVATYGIMQISNFLVKKFCPSKK